MCDLRIHEQQIWERCGYEYQPAIDWNFSNAPKIVKEEIYRSFKDPKVMCNLKPLQYAQELLELLPELGCRIIIITVRHNEIEKQTREMVQRLFGDVKLYIVPFNTSKLEIMKKEKMEFWIDDSAQFLKEYEASGIRCIMISDKYSIHNHYLRNEINWVKNVGKIYEDLTIFKRLKMR